MADAELLFGWANAPDSLAGKEQTSAPVPWDEHRRWLSRRLKDKDTLIRIAERAGVLVGQVRLQRRGDAFDVDIYIVPAERRGGVAGTAITAAVEELGGMARGSLVRARARADNSPSQRLFESLGFELTSRDGSFLTYMSACTPSSETP